MFKIFVVVGALTAGATAHAYVPPSFFIVRNLAHKHAMVDEGRFRHKVTFYKSNGEATRTLNETVVLTDAENAIVQLSDENGNPIATRTRKLVGNRVDELNRPVTYDLLMMKDGPNVFSHLRALGLPLKTESDLYSEKEGTMPYKPEDTVKLERYDRRVAVVVGTDSKSSQLWIEKDSMLPLRAIVPSAPEAGMSSEPLEFKFSTFQVYKSLLYPRTTQVLRGGKLWAKIETQDVALAVGNRPEIKNQADLDGDTREFLETYFKWVR